MKSFDEIMIDPKFIEFMERQTEESKRYWEHFVLGDLEQKNEFEKAEKLHNILSTHKKKRISSNEKNKAADELLKRIEKHEKNKISKQMLHPHKKWISITAAAILIIALLVPASLYIRDFKNTNTVYNEITVPSGEKSTIKLGDGTIVWLNSESTLKYPASFNKTNREVYLEGEGYFNVAKQKGKKFTVNTQNIKVIALGTIFNVKSYPNDENIEATLVEGSIKFQQTIKEKEIAEVILEPDQKLVYRKKQKQATVNNTKKINNSTIEHKGVENLPLISIKTVNTSNIICWKDHLLVFENETFDEISKKMSRWYKMNVIIQDEKLKQIRFTGKFIHNETFVQVFEAISLTTPISYRIEENNIYIESN